MTNKLLESITKRRFVWVLSGLFPLLIFSTLMLLLFTEQQEKTIKSLLHEAATNAAHVVERAIVEQIGLLNGLAASRSLDNYDFAAFRLDAQRHSDMHPEWRTVILTDKHQPVFNLFFSPGEPIPPLRDPKSLELVWNTREAFVGDLARGYVAVRVPVVRDGNMVLTLAAPTDPVFFDKVLQSSLQTRQWEYIIVGSDNRVILASANSELSSGEALPQSFLEKDKDTPIDKKWRYGSPVSISSTNWRIYLFAPAATLEEPYLLQRLLVYLGGGLAAMLTFFLVLTRSSVWTTREETIRLRDEINERKRVEVLLKDELTRWQILVSQSRDGIVVLDQSGKVHEANESFARMLGYSSEEVDELHVWDWDRRWGKEQLLGILKSIDDSGDFFETIHWRKDGTVYDVEISTNAAVYRGQKLIFCVCRDISERKQVEETLRESEEKYRALFENMSEGFVLHEIITDENGEPCDFRFLEMNSACEHLTGMQRKEMLGRCVREITTESAWIERYGRVALSGEPEHFQDYSTTLGRWYEVFAFQPKFGQCAAVFTDISERIKTEQALKDSQTYLSALVRAIPDLVWVKDPEGVYLTCNSKFERFFGAKEKEIIGKTDYDFVDKELADFFRKNDLVAVEKGKPTTNEEELTFADDGHQEIIETIKTPMFSSDGKLAGVLGIGRDITDRKHAESELRYQGRLLKQMGSIAKIGGWEFDPATGDGSWTDEVARIHGLEPKKEPTVNLGLEFYEGESRLKIERAVGNAIESGEPYDLELELVTAQGVRKWVRTIGKAMVEDGKVLQVYGSIQDITEIRVARKRIQDLNNILRAIRDMNKLIAQERNVDVLITKGCQLLVDQRGYSSAMIILTNSEDQARSWARAGTAALSESMANLLENGKIPPCCDHIRLSGKVLQVAEDRQTVCETCAMALEEGITPETKSFCVNLVNEGTKFGYLVAARTDASDIDEEAIRLFEEMAGDIAYALSVLKMDKAHRASEQKRELLENQLAQAQKMEAVGRLAGGVAHDYNNMLSVIIGYSELALENVDPEDPLHADLSEILMAGKRSAKITRQLLAFARQQAIAPVPMNLNDTVESMLKMLRRLIGEDIDFEWHPRPGIWPINMDPSQIDQILANLLVNARDAISDVGKITIETDTECFDDAYCRNHEGFIPGDFVVLAVSDDGVGMTQEVTSKVFEPFFTTKELGQGTGLGLSTVYGIVKQNNGFINVYSEIDKGTTFKIYFPRYQGETLAEKKLGDEVISTGNGEVVLVVEDETVILKLAEKMLKSLGYEVLLAETTREALELAELHASSISLLMTDVVMPEMNGRELSERLQRLYPDLKCLFMSGYTANVMAHRGVLDDGVNFIQKPFARKDLAMKVRAALESDSA